MKKLYLEVTRDKYELPLLVCDTITELSKLSGVRRDVISRQLSQNRTGNVVQDTCSLHWFREVVIDD